MPINYPVTLSGSTSSGYLAITTKEIYIDGNRTDTFISNGSVIKPYKTIQDALMSITNPTVGYTFYIAPGIYTTTSAISFPSVPITIYGNRSLWTVPSVTVNNPYSVYDLNTIGTVIYAYTGATRSLRLGGSITGAVTINGFEDYESINFSTNSITISANSSPLFSHCTIGSKIISAASTSVITINDCQFSRPTVDDYNIDMTNGGQLICRGVLLSNLPIASGGTHANINLSGASSSSSIPNMIASTVGNYGITCGTAYTILGPDNILPVVTGTSLHLTAARKIVEYSLANQSASKTSTTLYTVQATGLYKTTGSIRITTAGTTGTVLLTLDGLPTSTISLTTLGVQTFMVNDEYKVAGETIVYTTTVSGNSGGVYRIDCTVEQIQ